MLIVVGTKALSVVLRFARVSLNGKDRDVKFECFEEKKQDSEEKKKELEKKKYLQESTLLAVTCPPNVSSGQMIQIRISSQQQLIQARVPPNVKAGQIFHVRVMINNKKPQEEESKPKKCVEKIIQETLNSSSATYAEKQMQDLARQFSSICAHCGSDETRVWKALPSRCRGFRLCEPCGTHVESHNGLFRKLDNSNKATFEVLNKLKMLDILNVDWMNKYVRSNAAIRNDDANADRERLMKAMRQRAMVYRNPLFESMSNDDESDAMNAEQLQVLSEISSRICLVRSLWKLERRLNHPKALGREWRNVEDKDKEEYVWCST